MKRSACEEIHGGFRETDIGPILSDAIRAAADGRIFLSNYHKKDKNKHLEGKNGEFVSDFMPVFLQVRSEPASFEIKSDGAIALLSPQLDI